MGEAGEGAGVVVSGGRKGEAGVGVDPLPILHELLGVLHARADDGI